MSRRLIILVSLFLWACHQKPAEILMAEHLIKNRLTTNLDSAQISRIAEELLSKTNWNQKLQINQAYQPGIVNIYIIDGNKSYIKDDDKLSQLLSNCVYAGSHIIFTDDAYMQNFLDRHHVIRDRHNEELKDDQDCFLYWTIGHELGHLVCGHIQGHFDAGPLDRFVKTSSLDNREELQADSFFVHTISPDKMLRISEERLMMNILNAEIEQKIGPVHTYGVGIIYDYTNAHIVRYARQPTHPEYVIRLSRMLELSSRINKDTGLNNLVGGFIKQLQEVK